MRRKTLPLLDICFRIVGHCRVNSCGAAELRGQKNCISWIETLIMHLFLCLGCALIAAAASTTSASALPLPLPFGIGIGIGSHSVCGCGCSTNYLRRDCRKYFNFIEFFFISFLCIWEFCMHTKCKLKCLIQSVFGFLIWNATKSPLNW